MMNSKNEKAPWVRLGDLIEQVDERNYHTDLFVPNGTHAEEAKTVRSEPIRVTKLGIESVRGISIEKKFIPTKANMEGVSLNPYLLVKPNYFSYVPVTSRNGGKITIALNSTDETYLVSSSYTVFKLIDETKLHPEYLMMFFKRTEFDRYARFNSWGSARETFDWAEMCRVKIPLPSIETQRELVAVYNGLKELAGENEKLLEPLSKSCEAFIVDCKKKYPAVMLKNKIEECKERNSDLLYGVEYLQGVTSEGKFDESKANTDGLDFSNYKIVYKNNFAYNPSRINVGSIALSSKENAIVSPMYIVFKITDNDLIPEYLKLWFSRKEFQISLQNQNADQQKLHSRHFELSPAQDFLEWRKSFRCSHAVNQTCAQKQTRRISYSTVHQEPNQEAP